VGRENHAMPRLKKKWLQPAIPAVKTPAVLETKISPEYLDVRQAALYMSVTVWTIRRLIADKKIVAKQVGKRFLVKRTDLDMFWQQAEAA
jgi:excisionase family DNA binding protein